MRQMVRTLLLVALAASLMGCASNKSSQVPAPVAPAPGSKGELILATTTSTQDSGLLEVLVPLFEGQTGYRVKVIAVGSGQALAMAERGEADAVLAHAPSAEKKLVDAGLVTGYKLVMHNDFVLVGPAADPAHVKGTASALEALKKVATAGATFVSRGDDSGTHRLEQELWQKAGIKPSGAWYLQSGTGMAKTLAIASEKDGYTIADRATYLAQRKVVQGGILVEGDPVLSNIYHVMQVNPEKFSKVNGTGGSAFVRFMLDKATQQIIAEFGKDKYGQPLFFADAEG